VSYPFVGEIRIFAGNFPPRGFAFCNGQLLPISQNTALFSLLGTNYGGDGRTNFALPNLQDRFPMHWGAGAGLTQRVVGESGGVSTVTLLESEIPAHGHTPQASASAATLTSPTAASLLATPSAPAYGPAQDLLPLATDALQPTGGGQPHENRQPYLALNFVIALQGIFPSRN